MKKSKKKRSKKNIQPVATAKKHWIVYILPSAFVIAGIVLLNGEQMFFRAAGLLVILFGFYRILSKANEKWHLTESHLIIEDGILPWSKKYQEVSVHDIYKTDSEAHPRLKRFKVGKVKARRRADDCSGLHHSYIANPEQFSNQLQLMVQKLPSNNLNTLYELKEKGAISEHEYNLIRLGHITQQHLS